MNKFYTLAGAAMVAFASTASAQSEKDVAAYLALMSTPHGSMPSVASPLMAGEARTGAALDVRYGRYSFEGSDVTTSTIGLGGNFAAGERGRVGIMLGRSAAASTVSRSPSLSLRSSLPRRYVSSRCATWRSLSSTNFTKTSRP